jgi:Xaa-Pro aminopeptidase
MIAALAGGDILVPSQFPYALGKELEALGGVSVEKEAVSRMRAVKTEEELHFIREVQEATEGAMKRVLSMIKKSKPRGDTLVYRDHPLTSEELKNVIQKYLIDRGCITRDTIVSCGPDTALPHLTGKGPLRPDEPIVIDLFPQSEETGYFADMTRTVVKGKPSTEIQEMYQAVLEAQSRAASRIRVGVSGAELQQETIDFFKEKGYESNARGFMHNLGHGVGLDVHEVPILGSGGGLLTAGNVVTIEPGLYYREYGGVRLEDMGAVTGDGFERFTRCKETLIL